ncbi:hypothetical protein [Gloeobacter kilaueensis]|uniref:Thioredoxin domain-containing protein n=1 Tax=Gloeobacter kilaueensis (strain ATCC BAA-2537 / CCAP 1431/1 / ULC 316 / JS1) TaxID=1183438 RepID=U5QH65_GLOK1|nr:hypothetical protein [Gloeobacter kilaueensis]AGY56995.1 hypothetical protein GKIL_0749 [Gloeobacter kilaueensis JS1]
MSKQTVYKLSKSFTAIFLAFCAIISLAGITFAAITDDSYEGNIFSLYGNNGALIPPRLSLAESVRRGQPAFVILYVFDSRDCKKQAAEVTALQARFGQAVNFIAVNVDAFPQDQPELQPYFKGEVPRLLLFDGQGRLAYDATGFTPARRVEPHLKAVLRQVPTNRPIPAPLGQ